MKTKLNLGKVAYYGDRKENSVILELEIKTENRKTLDIDLTQIEEYRTLSISGEIWSKKNTDLLACGQIYDEIGKLFPGNKKVQRIVEIWKRWHLNDINAGTRAQRDFLKDRDLVGYSNCRFSLELAGLLFDHGYKYGSGWLVEVLPVEIENEIIKLFK